MRRFLVAFSVAAAVSVSTTSLSASEADPAALEPVLIAQAIEDDVNDPLEPINRFIFEVNEVIYTMFLRGPTTIYTGIVPPPLQDIVRNILNNLKTPVILANDLLQGEVDRAGTTVTRFAINSTYGLGGMFDQATDLGYERHSEDFGQTLAVWGVPEVFYLVIPVLGPSNPRDAVGQFVVDPFFDPLGWYMSEHDEEAGIWARRVVSGFDEYGGVMDELDQIKKTSVDYYAAVRSMYRQRRNSEIRNGAEAELPPIPDLGYELDLDSDTQPAATDGRPMPESDELGAQPRVVPEGTPVSALFPEDATAVN